MSFLSQDTLRPCLVWTSWTWCSTTHYLTQVPVQTLATSETCLASENHACWIMLILAIDTWVSLRKSITGWFWMFWYTSNFLNFEEQNMCVAMHSAEPFAAFVSAKHSEEGLQETHAGWAGMGGQVPARQVTLTSRVKTNECVQHSIGQEKWVSSNILQAMGLTSLVSRVLFRMCWELVHLDYVDLDI